MIKLRVSVMQATDMYRKWFPLLTKSLIYHKICLNDDYGRLAIYIQASGDSVGDGCGAGRDANKWVCVGGEWKNYFMSLIFRYVHYPLHNLCFCFFLLPFQQHGFFLCVLQCFWKNMEKKEKYKSYLLQISLKDFFFCFMAQRVDKIFDGGNYVGFERLRDLLLRSFAGDFRLSAAELQKPFLRLLSLD